MSHVVGFGIGRGGRAVRVIALVKSELVAEHDFRIKHTELEPGQQVETSQALLHLPSASERFMGLETSIAQLQRSNCSVSFAFEAT